MEQIYQFQTKVSSWFVSKNQRQHTLVETIFRTFIISTVRCFIPHLTRRFPSPSVDGLCLVMTILYNHRYNLWLKLCVCHTMARTLNRERSHSSGENYHLSIFGWWHTYWSQYCIQCHIRHVTRGFFQADDDILRPVAASWWWWSRWGCFSRLMRGLVRYCWPDIWMVSGATMAKDDDHQSVCAAELTRRRTRMRHFGPAGQCQAPYWMPCRQRTTCQP